MSIQDYFSLNKEQLVVLKQNLVPFIFIGVLFVFLPFVSFSITMDPETVPRFLIVAVLLFIYSLFYIIKHWYSHSSTVTHGKGNLPIVLCTFFYVLSAVIALFRSRNLGDGVFDLLKIIFPVVLTYYFTVFLRGNRVIFMYCIISCYQVLPNGQKRFPTNY